MHASRRELLRWTALAGSSRLAKAALPPWLPTATDPPVRRVLLVTKCHLDVGFTMTQARVLRKYFDEYFPQAMRTAADLRTSGELHYTWTTGSWLLYEFLEQATGAQRRAAEDAIHHGDLAWHALPFSWQTEMLDGSMIEGALAFARTLDARFGKTTSAAKMTDVPGHTRGIVAPLHAAGVRMLDIGVNAASTPPDVPDFFVWRGPDGEQINVVYHRHDYGSTLQVPGTDTAIAIEVRTDNSGAHTPAEIAELYRALQQRFAGATVQATSLNDVAAVLDGVAAQLPVVTDEIGDTWIYGVASDPVKVARYRELARTRQRWIDTGRLATGGPVDRALLAKLLLAPEHTWGTDTKTYLDTDHYRAADLAAVLQRPGYVTMQASWQEKRDNLDASVATLPKDLRAEADAALAALPAGQPVTAGMQRCALGQTVRTRHFLMEFDPATGALTRLRHRSTGREWPSRDKPMALLTYQTLSQEEYASFLRRYIQTAADWAPRDFGKPGIERFGARASDWHPRPADCWIERGPKATRVVLRLRFSGGSAEAAENAAWPHSVYLELALPEDQARIQMTVTTVGKQATRMPEALWLTLHPAMAAETITLEKCGRVIDPRSVISGGGRSMHAVTGPVRCTCGNGEGLQITSLDAPLLALGRRSPLNFSRDLPNLQDGLHFCLFNNAWGTNYPQWCSGDWTYRFHIDFPGTKPV